MGVWSLLLGDLSIVPENCPCARRGCRTLSRVRPLLQRMGSRENEQRQKGKGCTFLKHPFLDQTQSDVLIAALTLAYCN